MDPLDLYIDRKLTLASLICTLFIIYPNIVWIPWNLARLDDTEYVGFYGFFIFRFFYFLGVFYFQLRYNLRMKSASLGKRLLHNLLFTLIVCLVFLSISWILPMLDIWAGYTGNILIFQFVVAGLICTFAGHVSILYSHQREKEVEIERLHLENLQSRCDALTNQINPHFFFNALNGISSLVRKKNDENTLAYITNLSDVFRYILQSSGKGLVSLEEELVFIQAFQHVMEVRFAGKLSFHIRAGEERTDLQIPVLSLLPLVENVTVHNRIDSEHRMKIQISLNEQLELVVSNPVYPKLEPADTNGTGLRNLQNRFLLLMNKPIRIESGEGLFRVYLPLK